MNFWEKVKKDLQKGIKEGIAYAKEGTVIVKEKAEVLGEEAKRQYKIFNLKTKVQKEVAELGGRVYDLSKKVKNPMLDSKVKASMAQIQKLEVQLKKLEGRKKVAKKKSPARAKGR